MMYETIKEACRAWVSEFNRVPGSVLEKLNEHDESVYEITPPAVNDRVRIVFNEYAGEEGEVIQTKQNGKDWTYVIRLNNGDEIEKQVNDIEVLSREGWTPMWSTCWTFGDAIDEEWLTGKYCEPHIQEMADLGFRLYESDDFGIVFGIDGAGYDFYEAQWIPLYKLRGLKWHKEAV